MEKLTKLRIANQERNLQQNLSEQVSEEILFLTKLGKENITIQSRLKYMLFQKKEL